MAVARVASRLGTLCLVIRAEWCCVPEGVLTKARLTGLSVRYSFSVKSLPRSEWIYNGRTITINDKHRI